MTQAEGTGRAGAGGLADGSSAGRGGQGAAQAASHGATSRWAVRGEEGTEEGQGGRAGPGCAQPTQAISTLRKPGQGSAAEVEGSWVPVLDAGLRVPSPSWGEERQGACPKPGPRAARRTDATAPLAGAQPPKHLRASGGLTPRPPGCRAPTCTGVCRPEGQRPSPHRHPASQSRRGMHRPQFYCQHPPFTHRVLRHAVSREEKDSRGLCVPSLRRACLEPGSPGQRRAHGRPSWTAPGCVSLGRGFHPSRRPVPFQEQGWGQRGPRPGQEGLLRSGRPLLCLDRGETHRTKHRRVRGSRRGAGSCGRHAWSTCASEHVCTCLWPAVCARLRDVYHMGLCTRAGEAGHPDCRQLSFPGPKTGPRAGPRGADGSHRGLCPGGCWLGHGQYLWQGLPGAPATAAAG